MRSEQLSRLRRIRLIGHVLSAREKLSHAEVTEWAERLPAMTAAERTELPGVSEGRAPQLPAGAIVAVYLRNMSGPLRVHEACAEHWDKFVF